MIPIIRGKVRMKDSDIKHEAGRYWVCDNKRHYLVMVSGITHSESESAYEHTADGLSIAVARANYLHKRDLKRLIDNTSRKG